MFLSKFALQNFRNYESFHLEFKKPLTVIIGPNTAGKTNFLEGIALLSRGKSFKAERDVEMVSFGQDIARVKGILEDETVLEVVVSKYDRTGREALMRRYLVNNLPKRRIDFASNFQALLFSPSHLDIIIGSPGLRRNFFDEVLEVVDRDYRQALSAYEKALKARNALLHGVKEGKRREASVFEYWDNLLIKNADVVSGKRQEFTEYINVIEKELIDFAISYDASEMSEERLLQYKDAEEASGMTLVGPQRDDFLLFLDPKQEREAKNYGSRGQQRLIVLQLKLIQLAYMEKILGQRPVLLLDDIFSELDDKHISEVVKVVGLQQTIVTTTHKEFLKNISFEPAVLELSLEK